MSKTLCVYCTRTNTTKKIIETVAASLDGDLIRITDGVNRAGPLGYVGAAVTALKRSLPEILSVNTRMPITEYDRIILGAPIWAETVCPLAKAFLHRYGPLINGKVFYVIIHMVKNPYDTPIAKLDNILGRPHSAHLSVSTKNENLESEIEAFISQIQME